MGLGSSSSKSSSKHTQPDEPTPSAAAVDDDTFEKRCGHMNEMQKAQQLEFDQLYRDIRKLKLHHPSQTHFECEQMFGLYFQTLVKNKIFTGTRVDAQYGDMRYEFCEVPCVDSKEAPLLFPKPIELPPPVYQVPMSPKKSTPTSPSAPSSASEDLH